MSIYPQEVYEAVDLSGLNRRPVEFQLSNPGEIPVNLECDADVTDQGRIGITATSLYRLNDLAEDRSVLWLSSEFEVERLDSNTTHSLRALAVLGDLAIHNFDMPVLHAPNGKEGISTEELTDATVLQLAKTKSMFELWLVTKYVEDVIQIQDFFVDELGNISISGAPTEDRLTSKERQFLKYLSDRRNQVCTTEKLYAAIWGDTGYIHDTSSLRVMVKKMRTKLKAYEKDGLIRTLFGIGYVLEVPDEQE